jgi:hypothetical protein
MILPTFIIRLIKGVEKLKYLNSLLAQTFHVKAFSRFSKTSVWEKRLHYLIKCIITATTASTNQQALNKIIVGKVLTVDDHTRPALVIAAIIYNHHH